MGMGSQGLLGLAAFSAWWSPSGGAESISGEELQRQIEANEAPTILDVRSAAEFQSGHLPGAANIPFKEIEARVSEIPGRADDPILLYCAIGPRAIWAVKSLRNAGRDKLLVLAGHFAQWKKSGRPIEP